MVLINVHLGRLELPRGHSSTEQNIKLSVRPPLHLWQEEERHDEADHSGTAPDITAFSGEIPAGRVQQPRSD